MLVCLRGGGPGWRLRPRPAQQSVAQPGAQGAHIVHVVSVVTCRPLVTGVRDTCAAPRAAAVLGTVGPPT